MFLIIIQLNSLFSFSEVCVCVCIEIKYSLHIINLRFFKLRRKTFYNSEKYIYTTLNKYENIHIYKKNDEQEK